VPFIGQKYLAQAWKFESKIFPKLDQQEQGQKKDGKLVSFFEINR